MAWDLVVRAGRADGGADGEELGGYSSVTSTWTEPSVTCNSTNDLMAPWVGIDGDGVRRGRRLGYEDHTSAVSGGSFSISYLRE